MESKALSCPVFGCSLPSIRLTIVKVNRLIAWFLLVMPWLHAAMGTPFLRGLLYDAVLLAVHGVLSLVLFGLPRAHTNHWMVALGLQPMGMTQRNIFLLSGWTIAAGWLYPAAIWLINYMGLTGILGSGFWWIMVPATVVVWITLPVRLIEHISQAAHYATARWRVADASKRTNISILAVVTYLMGQTVNILLWVA
jgi:hypothetical protein